MLTSGCTWIPNVEVKMVWLVSWSSLPVKALTQTARTNLPCVLNGTRVDGWWAAARFACNWSPKTERRWRRQYLKQSKAQKEGGAVPNLFMQLQIVACQRSTDAQRESDCLDLPNTDVDTRAAIDARMETKNHAVPHKKWCVVQPIRQIPIQSM